VTVKSYGYKTMLLSAYV